MLLNENLPKPLIKHFSDNFFISTVPDEGWSSLKNGELISAMVERGYQYLLTGDRNLEFQQNLPKYPIKFIVIISYDNRYKTLVNHVSEIEQAI